jgi:hypothetical protein
MAVAVHRVFEYARDEPREIHDRCVTWGAWARCALPGAEGTSEGYLRERTDAAHAGEPTEEVAETERAVNKMRMARPDYWSAFKRYYLNPTALSEEEISDATGYNPLRVNAMLRQARMLIAHYLHKFRENA